jgi:hypothetical protein
MIAMVMFKKEEKLILKKWTPGTEETDETN